MSDEQFDYKQWHEQSMAEFWERIDYLKKHDPATIRSLQPDKTPVLVTRKGVMVALALGAVSLLFGIVGFMTYPNIAASAACVLFLGCAICVPLWMREKKFNPVFSGREAACIGELACIVFASALCAIFNAGNILALALLGILTLCGIASWGYDFAMYLLQKDEHRELVETGELALHPASAPTPA